MARSPMAKLAVDVKRAAPKAGYEHMQEQIRRLCRVEKSMGAVLVDIK
jgi:hypothetical protein